MAEVHGPKIVRDGLVLNLDAADKSSYPGSGTTWYDLSGNNFHHTITNSPTYNGNSFTLNETQGFTYASTITTNTLCTIVLCYKSSDTQELWVRGNNNGSFYVAASYLDGNYYQENSGTSTYYIDNVQQISPSGFHNNEYHVWEAKNVNFSTWTSFQWFLYGSSWNLNGTVAKILMYNRSLTAKESEQNYKALKPRFT
jgi:hypothetical protein